MTKHEAVEILEEVKTLDDSMFAYSQAYNDALEMAVDALKAHETSLEQLAEAYGLTVDGVQFALEQYQTVICEITHSRMSKLSYFADDILRLANDLQCEGCELQESRVMTLEEALGGEECWVEYANGGCGYADCYLSYTEKGADIYRTMQHDFNVPLTNYGKTWRCWTSRPSPEQREATPWH